MSSGESGTGHHILIINPPITAHVHTQLIKTEYGTEFPILPQHTTQQPQVLQSPQVVQTPSLQPAQSLQPSQALQPPSVHQIQHSTQIFPNARLDYNYSGTLLNLDTYQSVKTRTRWNESPEARERRLARNAARMRDKRAKESNNEYKSRLAKNAEANRIRRQNENEVQRALRLMKNAARQRLRRATETPDERIKRLSKAAERMRTARANAPKIEKPPLADRLIGY